MEMYQVLNQNRDVFGPCLSINFTPGVCRGSQFLIAKIVSQTIALVCTTHKFILTT